MAVIKVVIAVKHQTHRPSYPLGYCRVMSNLVWTNSASIDGAMSIDVIGYFHVITCFDSALSLDTFWIQRALWGKVVSTPCRERVNARSCGTLRDHAGHLRGTRGMLADRAWPTVAQFKKVGSFVEIGGWRPRLLLLPGRARLYYVNNLYDNLYCNVLLWR
jgi:hypothetical protein